ncbi:hypothetical protein BFS06_12215 [Clostridium perfringens]|uniref:Conjugal transfer protein TrbC n=1 Tax=Clostridium perfringens TaxID=1502 RepID=A0A140GR10_CLOPF|nr:hypothetical protein [Clostridium perfringens]AMN30969.1 hypothetical protein JFP838_pA0053 [Clostridium perfringens]TBX14965.1 hypothetical protein BFS06_12215 [Clostridium perfringens]
MKNKIKNKVLPVIIGATVLSPLFCTTLNVYADTNSSMNTAQVQKIDSNPTKKLVDDTVNKNSRDLKSNISENSTKAPNATDVLPNVGLEKASGWASKKGNDIVSFLQTAVRPLAIAIFIGCAILSLFGAFGGSGVLSKGLWGMGIAVFMYTAVTFAPNLLDFFSTWLSS